VNAESVLVQVGLLGGSLRSKHSLVTTVIALERNKLILVRVNAVACAVYRNGCY